MKYSRKPTFLEQRLSDTNGQKQPNWLFSEIGKTTERID